MPALNELGVIPDPDKIREINGIPLSEIDRRARPKGYSSEGFIGEGETFIEVLKRDAETVRRLGTSHQELVAHLRRIVQIAVENQDNRNFDPIIYDPKLTWPGGIDAPAQTLDVDILGTHGQQEGLFANRLSGDKNIEDMPWNEDVLIKNVSNDLRISLGMDSENPDVGIIGYIERYGFYEGGGRENCYRVDPEVLYAILTGQEITEDLRNKDSTVGSMEKHDREREKAFSEKVRRELETELDPVAADFFRSLVQGFEFAQLEQLLEAALRRDGNYDRLLSEAYKNIPKEQRGGMSLTISDRTELCNISTPDRKHLINLAQQAEVLKHLVEENQKDQLS